MPASIDNSRRYSLHCGDLILASGREEYRVLLPPRSKTMHIQTGLKDDKASVEYRANGRSSVLNNVPYFIFGETFHMDVDSETITALKNTSGAIMHQETSNMVVSHRPGGVPVPFLELTDEERAYEIENECQVVLIPEGGICVAAPPVNYWVWYKHYVDELDNDGTDMRTYCGCGIASVTVQEPGCISAERTRHSRLIFTSEEPAFGTFCAVRDENVYYLWGNLESSTYLARVGLWHVTQRELYEYWNGLAFTTDMSAAEPVLQGHVAGSFFKTELFGHRYSWAFVGSTRSEQLGIGIGYATRAEGPYQITHMIDFSGIARGIRGSTCVYAHPWAAKQSEGHLLVTWYEESLKTVMAVTFELEMLHREGRVWQDISMREIPEVMMRRIRGRTGMIEAMARLGEVHCEIETDRQENVTVRLLGTSKQSLSQVTKKIAEFVTGVYESLTEEEGFVPEYFGLPRPSFRSIIHRHVSKFWFRIVQHARKDGP